MCTQAQDLSRNTSLHTSTLVFSRYAFLWRLEGDLLLTFGWLVRLSWLPSWHGPSDSASFVLGGGSLGASPRIPNNNICNLLPMILD
jgi:hypothetical protein